MWPYINLAIAALAAKGALNRCTVSISIVISFLIIGLFQLLDLVPSNLYSFAFGSVVYALPCVVAYSLKFTKKRAFMALFSCLLMLLEFVAAYLWLIDSYASVGLFYRPTALALYSLLAIACFWGSNGKRQHSDGGYNNRHKYHIGFREVDRMGFKRGGR